MVKSYRQTLRELFPTSAILQAEIAKHGTKQELAFSLGMKVNVIYDHIAWLKKGRVPPMDRRVKYIEPDSRTMDATVKSLALAQGSKNVVKVYRATEEFKQGQIGYEGLELIGEQEGKTWYEVGHLMNPRLARKVVAGFVGVEL